MISTVLIVDDNESIIELISEFLKDEGCTPISTHFLQAEQFFSSERTAFYDMVVINGHPAYYESILKLHFHILSSNSETPVFVLTNKFEIGKSQMESLKSGGCVLIDDFTCIFSTLAKKLHAL
jgi:DNA-binding NtrC family response regulator